MAESRFSRYLASALQGGVAGLVLVAGWYFLTRVPREAAVRNDVATGGRSEGTREPRPAPMGHLAWLTVSVDGPDNVGPEETRRTVAALHPDGKLALTTYEAIRGAVSASLQYGEQSAEVEAIRHDQERGLVLLRFRSPLDTGKQPGHSAGMYCDLQGPSSEPCSQSGVVLGDSGQPVSLFAPGSVLVRPASYELGASAWRPLAEFHADRTYWQKTPVPDGPPQRLGAGEAKPVWHFELAAPGRITVKTSQKFLSLGDKAGSLLAEGTKGAADWLGLKSPVGSYEYKLEVEARSAARTYPLVCARENGTCQTELPSGSFDLVLRHPDGKGGAIDALVAGEVLSFR